MKVHYNHLARYIENKPSLIEISEKLFQLGHEHEIEGKILNIELTPNRGDCLSLDGLLRELKVFFSVNIKNNTYEGNLDKLDINFKNKCADGCPSICFLKIDIDQTTEDYKDELGDYFKDLNNNKINFFTDISNYISYETGQPTHCYDALSIKGSLCLEHLEGNFEFDALNDRTIKLQNDNMIFTLDDKIINLAGIMGGKSTACKKNTTSVIIECAFFNPEFIIGKSIKYNLNSDAAYKFERFVDPNCHDYVLRRFIYLVGQHTKIKNLEFFETRKKTKQTVIDYDFKKINKVLGVDLTHKEYLNYFSRLNFTFKKNKIEIPSYRNDIKNHNDLAEEIARVIGYNNIDSQELKIETKNKISKFDKFEIKIKSFFVDNGFYEVINFPFSNSQTNIKLDNPLDSNKPFYRDQLKDSLISNLLFNEKRQKDSIKLFEISDIYKDIENQKKIRKIGVIASGRVNKNYLEFSKKIDSKYMKSIFQPFIDDEIYFEEISRDKLDTKIKTPIFYFEISTEQFSSNILNYESICVPPREFIKYEPISDFPTSNRDLSFLVKDPHNLDKLQNVILNSNNDLLKDVFIFDYFKNVDKDSIKIGFRFIFQSKNKTITDIEVDTVINSIIRKTKSINGVEIPGLNQ